MAEDIDAKALLIATRPRAAPDPAEQVHPLEPDASPAALETPHEDRSDRMAPIRRRSLLGRAMRAAELGNLVRAAMLRRRAAQGAGKGTGERLHSATREDLTRLAERLAQALELSDAERELWSRALAPLLEPATSSDWTPEARFLYDLQKVCIDSERGIYALDVWRRERSLGQK